MEKRISVVISTYDNIQNPFYGGGGAAAIHEVAKRLNKTFKIQIITANHPGVKNDLIDGVSYCRIGPPLPWPRFGQLLFSFLLPFYVTRKDYDVWVESFTPPFSTSFLPLFTKRPIIGLVHMLSSKDMLRKYHLPLEFIENLGLKFYSYFISLTRESSNRIRSQNSRADIAIIPNGVNFPSIRRATEGSNILFLGRLEVNQKGVDLLLEAYSRLSIPIPKLVIAGRGSTTDVNKIKALVKDFGIPCENVVFMGRVGPMEKQILYTNAACVIIPSRFETFPLVALEAFSYCLPVVCFDIPGLSWITNSVCLKVPPFESGALSNAINKIVNDPKMAKGLGQKGERFAKKFSWDRIAKEHQKFISKIINKPQHG